MSEAWHDPKVGLIEVRGLGRSFKKKHALEDVTLTIPRGGVYGLLGENGAGKTTFVKHLLGTYRAQRGTVSVFGYDPVQHPVEVLSRIGYLSEDRDLPGWMRVRELMRYTQAFYPSWDEAYAESLREKFALDAETRIKNLSRGERAKVGLLVALAYRPELLLLDEPSAGLDPGARRHILEAIVRTVAEEGRTVIFSSHLLDEVERVSDRVAMIHHGRVLFSGELDEVKARHARMVLMFDTAQERFPLSEGVLYVEGSGKEWIVLANGRRDMVAREAAHLGGRVVEESEPSLEQIFLAHTRQSGAV